MSNDDPGKQHIKKVAAVAGTGIGAGVGQAIGYSVAVPTTSFLATSLGGVMLGTSLLLGGGAILGAIACYKLAEKLLENKEKE